MQRFKDMGIHTCDDGYTGFTFAYALCDGSSYRVVKKLVKNAFGSTKGGVDIKGGNNVFEGDILCVNALK